MFKKISLVAGVVLAISASAQADYQWEVDAVVERTNIDVDFDDGDVDKFGIGGSYYLDSVDTSKGPLGEAAFLDHASNVSLSYIYTDADDIIDDLDGDEYKFGGRYITDSAGWIFEGSYQRNEPNNAEVDTYSLGFGKYLTDATTLTISYANADIEDGGDTDGYQASVEHLWHWTGGGFKLSGNLGFVNVEDNDDTNIVNIAGTWYITDNLGLRFGHGYTETFNQEFLSTDVSVEWFISEQIALSAKLGYAESDDDLFDGENSEAEITSVAIGARLRF
jgi:putative general porin